MVTIELNDVQLHGYHGIYEGEKTAGGMYEINLQVAFEEGNTVFERLSDTINYEALFGIIKECMHVATPLLEKLAENIVNKVKKEYLFINDIRVSVYKLNAPMQNFQGKVGVTVHKKFND